MFFSAIWKSRVSRSSRMNMYIYICVLYIKHIMKIVSICLNCPFRNLHWSYLSYSLIWYFRFMKFPLVGPLSFSWFRRVWLGSETQHQTRRIISSFTSRVMVRRRESPEKKHGIWGNQQPLYLSSSCFEDIRCETVPTMTLQTTV